MTKIREYPLNIGSTKIYAPISKILSVQEKNGQICLWAENKRPQPNHYFIFLTIPNDVDVDKIAYFEHAKYITTVLMGEEQKPLHVYMYHQPGKIFLPKELEREEQTFFDTFIPETEI